MYIVIFYWKNVRICKSFCRFSHFFNKKYQCICNIYILNFNETLTNNIVNPNNQPLLYQPLASLCYRAGWFLGELIGYSWSSVRHRPSVVNNFKHLLQNCLPDQSQILCGASLSRGIKVCSRHLGHMTKMATMPIYGKNL